MRVLEWDKFLDEGLAELELPGNAAFSAMTIGVFDGIHRGHTALIERIIGHGRNSLPVIVTFRQNHKKAFDSYPGDISSFNQKITCFEKMGAAITIAADLTESFKHMSGAQFLQILQERGKMGFCAVGSNFRCGFHQDTAAITVKEINARENIPTEIVEVLTADGKPISSSRIREAIACGKLSEAKSMLDRPYILDLTDDNRHVLPPQGKYPVTLYDKKNSRRQAVIVIEEGRLIMPDSFEYAYIEF